MSRHTATSKGLVDQATTQATKSLTAAFIPYIPPWLLAGAVPAAGAVTHHVWGGDPMITPVATLALGAGTTALTALGWRLSRARAAIYRWHTTVTATAAGFAVTVTTITGVTHRPVVDVLAYGGILAALSWNFRRLVRGDGTDGGEGDSELFSRVKLAGAKARQIQLDGPRVTAQVQLAAGEQTVGDLQNAKDRLASGLKVPSTGIRIVPDPDRADRAALTVVPVDMLRRPIPWGGPSASGANVAAALMPAVYEDGIPVLLQLTGDKAAGMVSQHVGIFGTTGAGKTEGGMTLAADILTRTEVIYWLADPVKGVQSAGQIAHGLDWFESTKAGTVKMIKVLPDVIAARTQWLGERGFKQWEPGCGIPYLVVHLEEAAAVAADSPELMRAGQQARSAGMSLVISLQRPTYTNLPIDLRQMLTTIWCFGLKAGDAQYALSDVTLDSGANPEAWGNSKPGYSYLETPLVSEDRWPVPMRSWMAKPVDLAVAVAAHAPIRAACDPVTAAAAGQAYATRTRYPTPVGVAQDVLDAVAELTGRAPAAPAYVVNPPTEAHPWPTRQVIDGDLAAPTRDADPDDDLEDFEMEYVDTDEIVEPPANPEPGLGDDVDTSEEIGGEDDPILDFPPPAPPSGEQELTSSQARAALELALRQLAEAGHTTVAPKDLVAIRQRIGRSPSWLTRALKALVAEGVLVELPDRGLYGLSDQAAA